MVKNRIKYFKSLARKTLLGDWVSHVCAYLVVLVCFTGISYMGYAMGDFLLGVGIKENYIYLFPALYMFLSLFVIVPVILGVFNFEEKVVSQRSLGVSDVFYAFSSERSLNRAYRIFISFVIRAFPGFLPALALLYYINALYVKGEYVQAKLFGIDLIYLALNTLLVIFMFVGVLLSAKHLVGLYYAIKLEKEDIGACFLMGRVASHTYSFEILRLSLGFLPLFVMSLFTLGFLFVVYTLPLFFLSFAYMAEFLYNKNLCQMQTDGIFYELFEKEDAQTDKDNLQSTQQCLLQEACETEMINNKDIADTQSGDGEVLQ